MFGWAWLLCEQSKQTGPNSRRDASSLVSIKPFWTKACEFRVLEWLQGQGRNFRSPTQMAHKIWKSPARGTFKIFVETIRLQPKKQNDMEILFCPRLPQIPPHDPSRRKGCFHKMLRSTALIPTPPPSHPLAIEIKGYLDWYHYNFHKLEICYYNSPNWRYTTRIPLSPP